MTDIQAELIERARETVERMDLELELSMTPLGYEHYSDLIATALHEYGEQCRAEERERIAKLERCVGFFSSVIKSGESWTEQCQQAYDATLAQAIREDQP